MHYIDHLNDQLFGDVPIEHKMSWKSFHSHTPHIMQLC